MDPEQTGLPHSSLKGLLVQESIADRYTLVLHFFLLLECKQLRAPFKKIPPYLASSVGFNSEAPNFRHRARRESERSS